MKNSKKNSNPGSEANALNFEQAIQRLELIVADMESAELPLDDVLKKYEEGTRLVRFCSLKLDEAEKKIELLQKKADGTVTLQPLDAQEAAVSGDEKKEAGDEEEANLF